MTGQITEPQKKCINVLMQKLGVNDQRSDIVAGVSNGRTESVRELSKEEGAALIQYLKTHDPEDAAAERMRRKLIGMAYEYRGLGRTASKVQKQDAVNWLNDWCMQYGYLHKRLNQYQYKELPQLLSQFENVMKSLFRGL